MEPSPAWTHDRAARHALQLAHPAAVGRVGHDARPTPDNQLAGLGDAAADGYRAAFPDGNLITFTVADIGFLFDHSFDSPRAARTVAAWTYAHTAPAPRDRSRQTGVPLPAALAEAGYERGHLIAHATGGGRDAPPSTAARRPAHVRRSPYLNLSLGPERRPRTGWQTRWSPTATHPAPSSFRSTRR